MVIHVLSLKEGLGVILNSQILTALISFALYILILIPLLKILQKIVLSFVKHTETTADDELVSRLNPLLFYFFGLIGFKHAYNYSGFWTGASDRLELVINSMLVFIVLYAVYVFFDVIIEHAGKRIAKRTKSTADDHIIELGQKTLKIACIVISILIVLSMWGVNLTSVLAGLGIAGIAVGLALQPTLSNIFGGISLILDHVYRVGDKIKLESGEVGIIEEIGLRSTKIRDFDNKEIIIPNGVMANAKITNYVKPTKKIKFTVNFGVAYGTDPDKVKKVVLATLKKIDKVIDDPAPSVVFTQMADSSLNFKAMAWVDDYNDEFAAQEEANCKIYDALNKAKIEIPFPQSVVHLKK